VAGTQPSLSVTFQLAKALAVEPEDLVKAVRLPSRPVNILKIAPNISQRRVVGMMLAQHSHGLDKPRT
jgi:hypothetical protein